MASGIKCSEACIEAYNDLKFRKTHRYILFHIPDNKEIRVCYKAQRSATYEDFVRDLVAARTNKEGRYAVYDYETDGKLPSLLFIVWTPADLDIRSKMIYAASKDAIKGKLIGLKNSLEAHDLEDISEEELRKKSYS
ncbi:hypothetical protein P879_07419 [Paragonimus westermani]|uniref:Cofilin/tropomyosin-type actin-binding protein n=5 Tax=Paragonimus TaxID=34503 RepID=A0A8J4SVW9_9TREM|nr:Cofilin/tropomyosin-type actin-binding protein [Paragonimus heterotremus]KAF7259996.1 hypothetical protein EG68_02661 [Paragonimus skrjabini miyazakii]KAF8564675.1 hypothetical protein P879_07419 [Paragonimus westermani]